MERLGKPSTSCNRPELSKLCKLGCTAGHGVIASCVVDDDTLKVERHRLILPDGLYGHLGLLRNDACNV